jgi:hypothetical protein
LAGHSSRRQLLGPRLTRRPGLPGLSSRRRRCSHGNLPKVIDGKLNAGGAPRKDHSFFADLGQIETFDAVSDFHPARPLRRGWDPGRRTGRAISILHNCVSVRTQDCRAEQNHAPDTLRRAGVRFRFFGSTGASFGIKEIPGDDNFGADDWRRRISSRFIVAAVHRRFWLDGSRQAPRSTLPFRVYL